MQIDGRHYRTIWLDDDGETVRVIDQSKLPFRFEICGLRSLEDAARAIRDMIVRGAPLIGVTGAYGLALAAKVDASDPALQGAHATLLATRPTAINLRWALDRVLAKLLAAPTAERAALAFAEAESWPMRTPPVARRLANTAWGLSRKPRGGRAAASTS